MMLLSLVGTAMATPWYVPDDGEIQEVIAQAVDGDEIFVDPGYYPYDTGDAIPIAVDLTITGDATNPPSLPPLQIREADVTIRDVDFPWTDAHDDADQVTGVTVTDGSLDASGLRMESLSGVGISGLDSDLTLTDCTFVGFSYAGIMAWGEDGVHDLTIIGGSFTEGRNTSVQTVQMAVVVDGTTFSDVPYGAALLTEEGSLDVTGAWFEAFSTDYMYGISTYGSDVSISDTTFYNLPDSVSTMAASLEDDPGTHTVQIRNVTIQNDSLRQAAGGISASGFASVDVDGLRVENVGSSSRAGLYLNNTGEGAVNDATFTGGVKAMVVYTSGPVAISRSRFCDKHRRVFHLRPLRQLPRHHHRLGVHRKRRGRRDCHLHLRAHPPQQHLRRKRRHHGGDRRNPHRAHGSEHPFHRKWPGHPGLPTVGDDRKLQSLVRQSQRRDVHLCNR